LRKRLRKKKRLGEFREYGFHIRFLMPGTTAQQWDSLLDEWIDFIESQRLQFGGGFSEECEGFVERNGRGSVTVEQRQAVSEWLANHPAVTEFRLSDPVDAWHGPFDPPW
jgi:uncharacterized protein YggL (DUF469 family)